MRTAGISAAVRKEDCLMIQGKEPERIRREFRYLRKLQIIVTAGTLFFLLFMALVYRRPDIFGGYSKTDLLAAQVLSLLAYAGFSAFNWRCPACKSYLGPDISKRLCKNCGARLS